MSKLAQTLLALALAGGMAACTQTICQDGHGGEVNCEDPNLTSCESSCVDTDISPDFCGSCDNSCAEGQGCSAGSCVDVCDAGQLNCGGECIDPTTNADFCGASGTCTGANAGTDWNYGGTIGVPGAETACQTLYSEPAAKVCNFAELLDAQTNGELVNATDSDNNPVTEWWILDPTQNVARQCTNTDVANGGANVPWSYQTAHIGQGAKFVSLTAGSGSVSQVVDIPSTSGDACDVARNVPCCLP